VSGILRVCAAHGVPVVAQGGNTGLVGGSVPDDSGTAVVLSTRRLDGIGDIDRTQGQVTVGAGAILAGVQQAARAAGFDVPVDLAARQSATVGGMAATNAGGLHVIRHGTMRQQVLGFEAVLAGGEVLAHLGGLLKDNTGYDLAGLLCGSEGTLAVLTRLRLRLVPLLPHRVTALVAWPSLEALVAGFVAIREQVPSLETAEYFVAAGEELVLETFGGARPFDRPYPAYLILEAAGPSDPTELLAAAVGEVPGVLDVAVAGSAAGSAALWRVRELHSEALGAAGPPRKYDVTVPVGRLTRFVDAAVRLVEDRPGLVCHHFGHVGDGNVHVNVLGAEALDDEGREALDGAVLGLVAEEGGSISAEHGIGRLKRDWLHLSRSPAELAAMRALKDALDPMGILNPGVLLPPV
jgi:FAD/FMN-containing dehydrogenase